MRSFAAFLLLTVLAGCTIKIPPSTVTVPNTPEAQAGWRECQQIKQVCLNGCQDSLIEYNAVHTCVNSFG